MRKRDRHREDAGWKGLRGTEVLLKAGVFAGIFTVATLFLCAVLVAGGMLREVWIEGLVMLACVFGALIGGMYAAKRIGRRYLLIGLAEGGILFLLLLSAGMLVYGGEAGKHGGGILAACLCGGGIAGILSSKPGKRKKR